MSSVCFVIATDPQKHGWSWSRDAFPNC